jgi:hypothetical protein
MIPILMGPTELVDSFKKRETILFRGELLRVESVTCSSREEYWNVYAFRLSNGWEVLFREKADTTMKGGGNG